MYSFYIELELLSFKKYNIEALFHYLYGFQISTALFRVCTFGALLRWLIVRLATGSIAFKSWISRTFGELSTNRYSRRYSAANSSSSKRCRRRAPILTNCGQCLSKPNGLRMKSRGAGRSVGRRRLIIRNSSESVCCRGFAIGSRASSATGS